MTINSNDELTIFTKAAFPDLSEKLVHSYLLKKKKNDGTELKIGMLFFSNALESSVQKSIGDYIKKIDSAIDEISFVFSSGPANESVVLRILKTKQPITVEDIAPEIEKSGYTTDIQRLKNIVDVLRKNGLVHRLNDGKYSLTEKGLRTVPHGNYRDSSDVERALALGEKWR
jgi:predicted transcriptional regulator